MAAPRALVLAVLLATAVVNAEAASVVVGLAKCADCTRKNIKAQEAFKVTGAFRVPLAAGLHGNDCITQLHITASNAPCRGQEPSKIVPVSEGTTFGIVAGDNTVTPYEASPECASMTLCGPIKKHIIEHFHHKKPVPPKPEAKPQPHPNYGPVPLVENRALVRPEKSINPGCIMNRD
uniref:Uncharacterized protein n=1 Tax=Aegilops tauschii TaxID=37682 RepID=M8ARM3_AEGTA